MNGLDRDQVRLHVDADAHLLYALVSDVTRTPEWSPEVVSCTWLDGVTGPEVGARFTARNRRRWFTWSNVPVVATADRAREFAVTRTEHGGGTIRWTYRFAPAGSGTDVMLGYEVLQPVPLVLHVLLRLLLGVRDLRSDLHENMRTSLLRLADVARRTQHARGCIADG